MLTIETLHHVSVPVSNLARSKAFYRDVLGLREIERPAFDFDGAWYEVGDRHLHLIVDNNQTFRLNKPIDSHDSHFAIRVASYQEALQHLMAKGYRTDATDEMRRLRENRTGKAGFPQIYLLDPDRNVVEINAEGLE